MGALWDTIKDQQGPTRNIANADVEIAEDPTRGAPIRVQRNENLKFKPLDPGAVNALIQAREFEVVDRDEAIKRSDEHITELMSNVTLENNVSEDFSDLVGDLTEHVETRGRKRRHMTNAQRQKAYRERKATPKKLKRK